MTIKNNKKFKVVVLCIVVATTFWFFNAMNYRYTTNVRFPLKYNVRSNQLTLTSTVPKRIGINVYGTGWDILKASLGIGYEAYYFNLDTEEEIDIKSSTLMPFISKELAKLKINFIHEKNWKIRTDSILTKKINLIGTIDVQQENSLSLYPPIIEPDSIYVTGPRLYLDSLDQKMVLKVNQIKKSGTQNLDLEIKNQLNPNLKSSIEIVKIKFTIDNKLEVYDLLYDEDSTSRQIIKYTKPASYSNLNTEQLNTSITEQVSPQFYTIISTQLDTSYKSKDE